MAKVLPEVTAEMVGGINYWSTVLNIGAANIRTAIRRKALSATLVPLYPESDTSNVKTYSITGAQIMEWRNNVGRRSANTVAGTAEKLFVFKTMRITAEQAEEINAALAAAGLDHRITRKTGSKRVKASANLVDEGMPTPAPDAEERLAALELPLETEDQPKRGLFGLGKK